MRLGMSSIEETPSKLHKEIAGLVQVEKLPNAYLQKVLKKKLKLPQFRGVFPCNHVKKLREGESIILNTDPHFKRGKHFVALSVRKNRYIYFDPLAESMEILFPELHKELERRKMLPLVNVLSSPIQAPSSNFCGLFCLDYVLGLYAPFSNASTVKYELHPNKLKGNDEICLSNVVKKLKMK